MAAPPVQAGRGAGPHRVLVADPLGPDAERILLQAGFEVRRETGLAGEALVAALADRSGLLVRGATRVTAEVIAGARALKVIARAGAGTDNIDVSAAAARGVAVFNAPGANAVSVAEHTWGLIFAVLRHVPQADATLRAGRWEKNRLTGREVAGRTLGVIGLGWVGSEVARIGAALRCHVLGYDPDPAAAAMQPGIERVELDRVIGESDILSLHAPLVAATRHLLDRAALARMKPGAVVVNAARGGLLDEVALAEALSAGHLAGAGLDVFEMEPPGDHPLLRLPQVVVTPHLGGSTLEAQERAATAAAQAVRDYLAGGSPVGRVV